MPRTCSICSHAKTAQITKDLLAANESLRDLSFRFGVTAASLHRHRTTCLGRRTEGKRKDGRAGDTVRRVHGQESRFGSGGRCDQCGIVVDAADPQSLMRRAERLLWLAETIAANAQRDNDSRLALLGIDKARQSLEVLMKAHGMIGSDGVTINIGAEKREKMRADEALAVMMSYFPQSTQDERDRRQALLDFLRGAIGPQALRAHIAPLSLEGGVIED